MEKKDIELLMRILSYAQPESNTGMTNLVYVSPAQQLRNSADRLEQQERDFFAFKEFIEKCKGLLPLSPKQI